MVSLKCLSSSASFLHTKYFFTVRNGDGDGGGDGGGDVDGGGDGDVDGNGDSNGDGDAPDSDQKNRFFQTLYT